MPIFFAMAGFFANLVLAKYGAARFISKRLFRIGIPFLVGCYTLVPLLRCLEQYILSGIWQAPGLELSIGNLLGITGNVYHLWFLRSLLLYYGVALLVCFLLDYACPRVWTLLDKVVGFLLKTWYAPLVLGIPSVLHCLIATINSQKWETVDYWPFFAFGWLVLRQPHLLNVLSQRLVANGIMVVVMSVIGTCKVLATNAGLYADLLFAAGKIGYAWYGVLFAIGFFHKFLNFRHKAIVYLVDASYWIYLAQLPIVYAMQIALVDTSFNGWTKWFIVNVVTLATCTVSYHLIVRPTFLGTVLGSGRRRTVKSVVQPCPSPAQGVEG